MELKIETLLITLVAVLVAAAAFILITIGG